MFFKWLQEIVGEYIYTQKLTGNKAHTIVEENAGLKMSVHPHRWLTKLWYFY